jgi:hypothetical protein
MKCRNADVRTAGHVLTVLQNAKHNYCVSLKAVGIIPLSVDVA